MRRMLAVDVDSTVWDLVPATIEAVREVTGETVAPVTVAGWSTWVQILDLFGEEAATGIYEHVLDPRRVRDRRPYPGAPEALRGLRERGVGVHFVTHNPESLTPHLHPWLREHFGPEVGLTVTMEDKLDVLQRLGACGIVDDRPETLERVADAGLFAATLLQPWNRSLVARRDDVFGFERWDEFPDLLPILEGGKHT